MKDWKEKFMMFAFNEGSITKETADKYINFIEQIISERDKEVVEIITQHYIPGHMVVNPTLEAIITKIKNNN